MKSFLFPLLVAVLFFSSCSQDFISQESHIDADIEKRSNYSCIEDAICEENYLFRLKGPGSYKCFEVTFHKNLTLEEIYCIKQAYFKCFPLLCMAIIQSTNPYTETWCFPTGKPLNGISTTMDSDPRVDDGG